jgi:hypothetical protein
MVKPQEGKVRQASFHIARYSLDAGGEFSHGLFYPAKHARAACWAFLDLSCGLHWCRGVAGRAGEGLRLWSCCGYCCVRDALLDVTRIIGVNISGE